MEIFKKKLGYESYYHVKNIPELEKLLLQLNPEESCFVGYIWHEYAYIHSLIDYTFREFFQTYKNKYQIIGTCLPGMELFYRDRVDILIVLDNFINTDFAIKDSKYTEKWNTVKRTVSSDGGIAFWHTIKNFSEKEFDSMLDRIKFKNVIYPHYYGPPLFYKNKFGATTLGSNFLYSVGEQNICADEGGLHNKQLGIVKLSENYVYKKNNNYPLLFDSPYCCFFIRNCYKNYTGVSQATWQINFIIDTCIELKIHLFVFQDLFEIKLPDSEYIHEVKMQNYLDLDKFMYYTYNCSVYFGTPSSNTEIYVRNSGPGDLVLLTTKNVYKLWGNAMETFVQKRGKALYYLDSNGKSEVYKVLKTLI